MPSLLQVKVDRRMATAGRKNAVNNIWMSHYRIIQLHLQGMKNKEIADELRMSVVTVSRTLASPIVRDIVQRMLDGDTSALDVRTRLSNTAVMACEVIDQLMMNSEVSPAVRGQLAVKALDRAGFAPVQKHANVSSIFSEEEIEEMCNVGMSRGYIVEDVEFDDMASDTAKAPTPALVAQSDRERIIQNTLAMSERLIAMSENTH